MTADSDLARATTLPASWYHDRAIYERERYAIFATEWQLAGFRAQLRAPGDYVAHEFAGWRVFVIVADDSTLRGFHNVCRHRAGPLVMDDGGHCPNLVCRYHGWAYDLDGALVQARGFGDAADFDRGDFGLLPVRVDEWRGLVFVNLDSNAAHLHDAYATLVAECADLPIETLHYSHRIVHEIAANWKTYTDNYGEGYHIPLVHPELNREVNARQYRVDVRDHSCVHSAPTRDGAINAGRWIWRYPNLALNVYPDGMNVERFVPVGPTRVQVIYDYFFADLSPRAASANAEIVRIGCEVLDEDRVICEAVQRNLESGAYDVGRLSPRHENGLHAFQTWVRESFAAYESSAGSSSSASELMQ